MGFPDLPTLPTVFPDLPTLPSQRGTQYFKSSSPQALFVRSNVSTTLHPYSDAGCADLILALLGVPVSRVSPMLTGAKLRGKSAK
jgi:hypothetical protein